MKTILTSSSWLLLLCLLLTTSLAHAQTPAWQGALALAATGTTAPYALVQASTTDAAGNIYIGGQFYNRLQLGSITLTTANSAQDFVAKYSPVTNSFVWARVVGGNNVSSLAVSGSSVYVAGNYTQTATFGTTTLTNTDASGNTPDLYLAKLTDTGTSSSYVWAQPAGGTGRETFSSLAVSGSSVYVAGYFENASTTFGNITLANANTSTNTTRPADIFLAKLTDAGASASYTWALRAGGTGTDEAYSLVASGSTLYLGGGISGMATVGSQTLTSAGGLDAIVAKFTDVGASASIVWVRQAGGTADEEVGGLALGSAGLYVSGFFTGTTLGLGSSILSNTGNADGFVAKLTDTGTTSSYVWAQPIGGPANDVPVSLVVRNNNVYVGGVFNRPLTSGSTASGTGTVGGITLSAVGASDVFVARIVDAGATSTAVWAQRAGSTGEDYLSTIVLSGTSVYATGYTLGGAAATFSSTILPAVTGDRGFLAYITDTALPTRATAILPDLALFPNPARGTATVRVPASAGAATLTLFDALGRAVRTAAALAGRDYPLDLTGLVPGVYALRLQTEGATATSSLVVE